MVKTVLAIVLAIILVTPVSADETVAPRPVKWAQPIALKGVPNLHRVSRSLYRSAQPSAEGMANLKKMGIKTIVNLRAFHSDRLKIGKTGLKYKHIFMKTWHPEHEDVVRFLRIVTNPANTPVLVHCQHGADRTGTMSAIYRVVVEGWTKQEAIDEMTKGGFNFHTIWANLPPWIANIDVQEIRKEVGLKNPAKTATR